jgi:hypothetical protein
VSAPGQWSDVSDARLVSTASTKCGEEGKAHTVRHWKHYKRTAILAWIHLWFVGVEVFTGVVMKSIIFWDMTPSSLLSCNWCFGGTYRLHLQGRRNHFSKNQKASRWKLNILHGVISQKMILFISGSDFENRRAPGPSSVVYVYVNCPSFCSVSCTATIIYKIWVLYKVRFR